MPCAVTRDDNVRDRAESLENWQRGGFGIYVHWPFCAAKCPYCDFNSHVSAHIDQESWAKGYLAEIDRYAPLMPNRIVSSVFFGGGTPSLMEPRLVDVILSEISKHWTLTNDVEITLEANPTSAEGDRFTGYRDAGVNRVSIGVQALVDNDLKALGRLHNTQDALRVVSLARQIFDRVSFDLIYARQNQTTESWISELDRALSLEPDHLSLYQLTIEDGTAFGDRYRRGTLQGLPDEDTASDMYEATWEICATAGLRAYEVSNYAKEGHESRHNLIYWRAGDYLGIGPGAHGRLTIGGARHATETPLSPKDWLSRARSGEGALTFEKLATSDMLKEQLLMGLRLTQGIELTPDIARTLNAKKCGELAELGLLSISADRIATTPRGLPLLNAILSEIIA